MSRRGRRLESPRRAARFVAGLACATLALAASASALRASGSLAVHAGSVAQSDVAIETELRVRRWALDPNEALDELESALRAPRWPERRAALDALRRAVRAGRIDAAAPPPELADALVDAVDDEHPDVSALALGVLAAFEIGPREEAIERLARDPLPRVRRALVEALPFVASDARSATLRELLEDGDEGVARAAASVALAFPASDDALRLTALRRAYARGGATEAGRLLAHARAASPDPPSPSGRERDPSRVDGTTAPLLDPAAEALAAELDATDRRAARDWRAIAAAVELARLPPRSTEDALSDARTEREAGLVRLLVAGLFAGEAGEGERARLLARAAAARSERLALAVVDALAAPDAVARTSAQPYALSVWVELAVASGAAEPVLAHAASVLDVEGDAFGELLLGLAPRVRTWDPAAVGDWVVEALAPDAPEAVALLTVDALARVTFALASGPPIPEDVVRQAGDLVARALEHPSESVRTAAFRALLHTLDPRRWDVPLAACWRSLEDDRRREAVEWLAGAPPLDALRDDLLALGAGDTDGGGDGDARRVVLEVLAAYRGDAAVEGAVVAWLDEDTARFVALGQDEADDADVTAAARELEMRVEAGVRALAKLGAARVAPAIDRALSATLGRSESIGKVAAAALGRSSEGIARLAPYVAQDLDRRTRIEASIVLGARGDGAARDALMADYPAAAWNLRVRMLAALGAREGVDVGARARTFLTAVAMDEDEAVEERVAAVGALGTLGVDGIGPLARVVELGEDLDVRRAAIVALGTSARASATSGFEVGADARGGLVDEVRARLRGLARDLAPREDDTAPVREARALLVAELRSAFAATLRADEPPTNALHELRDEWLAAPLAAGRDDLSQRFAGRPLAGTEFRFWSELDLVEGLARAGADPLRALDPAELVLLDGEFVAAAGVRVLGAGALDDAERLFAAAVVALAGEPEPRGAWARSSARLRLIGLLWKRDAWEAFARAAAAIVRDLDAGELVTSAWREAFGDFDPAAGRDPRARLVASIHQARAWAALRDGDLEGARRAAARAAREVGSSAPAAAEQADLEGAVDAAASERRQADTGRGDVR